MTVVMDQNSSKLNQQTSSIPRPSKLPLPRPSQIPTLRPVGSRGSLRPKQPEASLSYAKRPSPSLGVTSFSKSLSHAPTTSREATTGDDAGFKKPLSRPVSRDSSLASSTTLVDDGSLGDNTFATVTPISKRRPRPSLSDRTVETLSQIPPSPASGHRNSGFAATESPMRASRPSPAASNSRTTGQGSRPSSPTKISAAPPVPRVPQGYQIDERSQIGRSLAPSKAKTMSKSALPSLQTSRAQTRSSNAKGGTSTISLRSKASSSSLSGRPQSRTQLQAGRNGTPHSKPKDATVPVTETPFPATNTKSSAALRESIARAKASASRPKPSFVDDKPPVTGHGEMDLFDIGSKGKSSNNGLLRKRIEAARTHGQLNIAAMEFSQIPDEVMKMYDFDAALSSDWAESVDLVKAIFADNDIVEVREDAFPDLSLEDVANAEEDVNFHFGGLEILDFHGNKLIEIPLGLRRLGRLQTLNLANNQLGNSIMSIIAEITSLKDLNLADNKLSGPLSPEILNLTELQVFDMKRNGITTLPEELGELVKMRKLDVSGNKLQKFPSRVLENLPLTDLDVSKNNLSGIFFPEEVQTTATLVSLDLSSNHLELIVEGDNFKFERLQILCADANRLKSLPNLSHTPSLVNISATDNSIATFPEGLVFLKEIRNVDLRGNNIVTIPSQLAMVESLTSLSLANNPLRERKYLTMPTDELKDSLRGRLVVASGDGDVAVASNEDVHAISLESAPTEYRIRSGVLDLSSKGLTSIEMSDVPKDTSIVELNLSRNKLTSVPVELLIFCSGTLRSLDLSNNPTLRLSSLSDSILLPRLSTLRIFSSAITSFVPIVTHLDAPSLTDLDISFNRLSGAFPPFRATFPSLVSINAADNKYTSLSYESARGLQRLNLGNNELSALEPKLGLLGGDPEKRSKAQTGGELKMLEVRGNRFRVPRWDVLDKGTEVVLKWLRDRLPEDEREIDENRSSAVEVSSQGNKVVEEDEASF